MDLYLFNSDLEVTAIVPDEKVTISKQSQKHNDLITHNVSVIYEEIYGIELDDCDYFGMQDVDDSTNFWIYKVTNRRKSSTNSIVELGGVHKFFDDLKGIVVRDIRPTNSTARAVLGQILNDTNWTIGIVNSNNLASTNYYYQPALDCFWDMLGFWQVEFKLRIEFSQGQIINQYVDIADQWSVNYGKWYEYGDKLVTVTAQQADSGIYTALIGRGKGVETEGGGYGRKLDFSDKIWSKANGDPLDKPLGQDYLELPEATNRYGYVDGAPRIGLIDFSDVEDVDVLIQSTYEALLDTSRPKQELSADVLETDLAETGEVVTIIYPKYNIRYQTRIFEYTRNFKNKTDKTIKFGDKVTRSAAERAQYDRKVQSESTQTVLDQVNDRFSELNIELNLVDSYKVELEPDNSQGLPSGTYWFNGPLETATGFVGATGGYFISSDSKDVSGNWVYSYIAGVNGLATDSVDARIIKAGSIDTDHLATNVLTASNIQLSGGETLENYINEASETHRDILPPSKAKKDDVWIKPKMKVEDLRDINMLELSKFGVTVSELLGGGVFVATGDISNSSFNNWVKIASDETFARGGITNIENGLVEVVKYGDLATAGRTLIDGNNIKTGRIQDELEENYIDLDLGEINFGKGDFTYSPNEGMQIAGFNVTKDGFETIIYEPFVNDYTQADMDKLEGHLIDELMGNQNVPPSEFQRLDINEDGVLSSLDMAHIEILIGTKEKDLLLARRILLNPMDMTISITSAIFRKNGEMVTSFGGTEITKNFIDATQIKARNIFFRELIIDGTYSDETSSGETRKGIDAYIRVDGKEYVFNKGILTKINDI